MSNGLLLTKLQYDWFFRRIHFNHQDHHQCVLFLCQLTFSRIISFKIPVRNCKNELLLFPVIFIVATCVVLLNKNKVLSRFFKVHCYSTSKFPYLKSKRERNNSLDFNVSTKIHKILPKQNPEDSIFIQRYFFSSGKIIFIV